MSLIDTGELLRQTNIVDVVAKHVQLKKVGNEHVGKCPFHNDTHASLKVSQSKQVYSCFVCGNKSGDAIAFLMALNYSFHDAVAEIKGIQPTEYTPKKSKQANWTQIKPTNQPSEIRHYKHGVPNKFWVYHNEDDSINGYVCRFDTPEGKEVLPFVFATDGARYEWRWLGFAKPRPLYNLHMIANHPDKTILIVEGEKTADAAQKLLPHVIVTTWIGGAKAIHHTDWSPLKNRKIVLWPDNDVPGFDAMQLIEKTVETDVIKWINNPEDAPKHWDVADADWTSEQAIEYVRANISDKPKYLITLEPEPEPITPPIINDLPPTPPSGGMISYLDFFKPLGFEKIETGVNKYWFFVYSSKTLVGLTASQMSKSNLMMLANLQFWEQQFPSKTTGMSNDAAINWIINVSNEIGVFSEKKVRGRGVWIDGDNVVIHAGDRLIVNGVSKDFNQHRSKYIYEVGEELGFDTQNPLTTKEAHKFIEILSMANWERDIGAHLFAGWCVIAPFCGALKWRPHIWLTGAAGTGKSWILENLLRRVLGVSALAVQGEATEPGIRQLLQHDALPVIFDEAEGEHKRDQERMQAVLALMRGASSSNGGIIAKGSSGGTAKTYSIKSCFAFASIVVQVANQADRTRITILSLVKKDGVNYENKWKQMQQMYYETINDDYCARLRARGIELLPIILKNAEVFSTAAAAELSNQRTGDQMGVLLAGAYSLYSKELVTYEKAIEWIKSKDWTEERGHEGTRDELSLLSHLMEQITRVETGSNGVQERTIGELFQIAKGTITDIVYKPEAISRLARLGMKYDNDYIVISNSADYVKKSLANTAWGRNHNKILMRIEGSEPVDSVRFASGLTTRAVRIPFKKIF
jgi:putative DNA primase/helicase